MSPLRMSFSLVCALVAQAWGATGASAEPCEADTTTVDLVRALGTAEAYFSSLNADGFNRAVEQSEQTLRCLSEEVPLTLAAEFHRYQAIRFFVKQESTECMLSFAAARTIEPNYAFPSYLVPSDNPLLDNYTAVDPAIGKRELLVRPRHGYFQIDGSKSEDRPLDFPTIVQMFDSKGGVQRTAYLPAGGALFEYERAKPKLASPSILAGAGAAFVTSAVLYALAEGHRKEYDCVSSDCGTVLTPSALDDKRQIINRLSIASGVLGATGAGLGATAFIVVRL